MAHPDFTLKDKELTVANRALLLKNRNLLLWYEKLYHRKFAANPDIMSKKILEIGSGTSPLKLFYPNVMTSDIMKLDYLDFCFDCHEIDIFEPIPDDSLDIISITNVLHHMKDPLRFLVNSAKKLKPGGKLILAEPFFSVLSTLIYRYLHPEPTCFDIEEPVIREIKGPLTSANIALPYLVFFSKKGWDKRLYSIYDFSINSSKHYSSLAYMVTGGISKKFRIPVLLYRLILAADIFLADRFPKVFSSFFILEMAKKKGTS